MADETLEEAQERRSRLVPDPQLYWDTNPFAKNEAVLMPVTLFVGSLIVTGKPVVYSTWYARLAARNSDGETMTVGSHSQQRIYDERMAELRLATEHEDEDHEFTDEEKMTIVSTFSPSMYLTEARVLAGAELVPGNGKTVDMRVRYASVDAWCYGLMTMGE